MGKATTLITTDGTLINQGHPARTSAGRVYSSLNRNRPMARIAFTIMRVTARPHAGKIIVTEYPYGMMLKDIKELKESTDHDMPGSRSMIITRGAEPVTIYTAHELSDLVGAVNDTIDLTITARRDREVER